MTSLSSVIRALVFSTLRSLLRARLIARMPWNYVDASNLASHERRQWVKMAKGFGYEVHAVFFDVPLEVCLERNRKRERQVKEEVIQRMAQKLKPPSFEEGFTKITVVRVKAPQQSDQLRVNSFWAFLSGFSGGDLIYRCAWITARNLK